MVYRGVSTNNRDLTLDMDRSSDDPFALTTAADGGATRNQARDSLLLSARFRETGSPRQDQVRIRNLSAGGLMVELPHAIDVGSAVEVEVRGMGWVSGTIAWNAVGRAGVAFDTPIDPKRARKPISKRREPTFKV